MDGGQFGCRRIRDFIRAYSRLQDNHRWYQIQSRGRKGKRFEERSVVIAPWTVWLEAHSLLVLPPQARCSSFRPCPA
jgi:hypothetical protein